MGGVKNRRGLGKGGGATALGSSSVHSTNNPFDLCPWAELKWNKSVSGHFSLLKLKATCLGNSPVLL